MTDIELSQCGSCRAPIVWAMSPAGKPSPIDAHPNTEKGNVLLLQPRGLGSMLAVVLTKDALTRARGRRLPLHTNHFVTCPDREEHRARADAKAAA